MTFISFRSRRRLAVLRHRPTSRRTNQILPSEAASPPATEKDPRRFGATANARASLFFAKEATASSSRSLARSHHVPFERAMMAQECTVSPLQQLAAGLGRALTGRHDVTMATPCFVGLLERLDETDTKLSSAGFLFSKQPLRCAAVVATLAIQSNT